MQCLSVLTLNMFALILWLPRVQSQAGSVAALIVMLTNYKVVATLYALHDVMEIMEVMSKGLQACDLSPSEMIIKVAATRAALQRYQLPFFDMLTRSDGKPTRAAEFPKECPGGVWTKTHKGTSLDPITMRAYTDDVAGYLRPLLIALIASMITGLDERFPTTELAIFSMFVCSAYKNADADALPGMFQSEFDDAFIKYAPLLGKLANDAYFRLEMESEFSAMKRLLHRMVNASDGGIPQSDATSWRKMKDQGMTFKFPNKIYFGLLLLLPPTM